MSEESYIRCSTVWNIGEFISLSFKKTRDARHYCYFSSFMDLLAVVYLCTIPYIYNESDDKLYCVLKLPKTQSVSREKVFTETCESFYEEVEKPFIRRYSTNPKSPTDSLLSNIPRRVSVDNIFLYTICTIAVLDKR